MAITRSDLRNKIRDKLYDWYLNQDTLSAAISSTTTTSCTVTTGASFSEGDIIEIDDESLKVTAVSSSTLTVIRGFKGTTAATHSNGATIYIIKEWGTKEINDAITASFRSLHPYIYVSYIKDIHAYGNRTMLDSLDATTGWTQGGDASAPTLDSSDYKEGSGSLKLGATFSSGSATYTKTLSTAVDATDYQYLNIWIKLGVKKNSSNNYYFNKSQFCIIRLGNDASNYGQLSIRLDEMKENSWNLLCLNLQDFTTTGTWTKSATDYLYIDFKDLITTVTDQLKMDEWWLSTYPYYTDKLIYRLPTDIFRLNSIRVYESDDSEEFREEKRWDVQGNYLVFREDIFEEGKPMQLLGDKALVVPSSDSTTIDLDDIKEELIVLYASLYLFERLKAERARFMRYSAKLNNEDIGITDVLNAMSDYQGRLQMLINQFEEAGKSVDMDYGVKNYKTETVEIPQ